MSLPHSAVLIIDTLKNAGIDAYAVGGCVRDALLGKAPSDYDIAAGASPEDICRALKKFRIIETGIKHGTVTVIVDGVPYEVTAFRVDSGYSDGRHPDRVEFCADIESDLARRDFTVNAIAYSPERGLIDPFGGRKDLENGILRAVGEPQLRFTEDALRILRLLRFASRFGFEAEAGTAAAALKLKDRLSMVSPERIFAELKEILLGKYVGKILEIFSPVIFEIIPELEKTYNFPQNTRYHKYDVWQHIIRTVDAADFDICVRLAMLLHDVAKPECFTEKNGQAHFHGHPALSAELAEKILKRLCSDRETIEKTMKLILYHDVRIKPERSEVKKMLNALGEKDYYLLMKCQLADAAGKADYYRDEQSSQVKELTALADSIIQNGECYKLSQLKISGRNLIKLGMKPGRGVGEVLGVLLSEVITENLLNETEVLEKRAAELIATIGCGK